MNPAPNANPNTIPHLLALKASAFGSCVPYEFPELGQRCTWLELWIRVQSLAKGLLLSGVKKGDRVAILLPDRIETIASFYAAATIGAVAVPLDINSTKDELVGYLADAGVKAMIVGGQAHGTDLEALVAEMITEPARDGQVKEWLPELIFALKSPAAPEGEFSDLAALEALGRAAGDELLWPALLDASPDDPLVILYTSGATGRPKAVVRTTASFLAFLGGRSKHRPVRALLARLIDMVASRVSVLSVLPQYHLAGLSVVLSNLMMANYRLVMLQYFQPNRALEALESHKCRFMYGTSFMLTKILNVPERTGYDLSRLIGAGLGGEAVSPACLRAIEERSSIALLAIGYASTEAGAVATGVVSRVDKKSGIALLFRLLILAGIFSGTIPYEKVRNSTHGVGGVVSKAAELRLVDLDTGEVQPKRVPGEIQVRASTLGRTTEVDEAGPTGDSVDGSFTTDGWLRTGDVGYIDDDDVLFIVDRVKRMISRGGEKISAAEVERCLLQHDRVAHAFVFPGADALYGEIVLALVVPGHGEPPSADELNEFMRARLSAFKVPEKLFFVEELPISAAGKLSVAQSERLARSLLHGDDMGRSEYA